jgi:hypothetical protein
MMVRAASMHSDARGHQMQAELLGEGGIATEQVKDANLVSFTYLKAYAFDQRFERKDAHDLISYCRRSRYAANRQAARWPWLRGTGTDTRVSRRHVPGCLRSAAWSRWVGDACLPEGIEDRDQDAESRNRPNRCLAAPPERDVEMTDDDMEIVRGSGNVFRDFGQLDPYVRQPKALLTAQIIKVLDGEDLTIRSAAAKTRIAHSEFVRLRNVNPGRFTIDRLVTIPGRSQARSRFLVDHPSPRRSGGCCGHHTPLNLVVKQE